MKDTKQRNILQLVEEYRKARDLKKSMEDMLKKHLAPVNLRLAELDAEMLQFLIDTGQKSAKTELGTVYRQEAVTLSIEDSISFYKFVKDADATDLLQRRINKSAYDQYIEDGVEVPGVKINRIFKARVRKT